MPIAIKLKKNTKGDSLLVVCSNLFSHFTPSFAIISRISYWFRF